MLKYNVKIGNENGKLFLSNALDTSSIINSYHREFDTERVIEILANDIDNIYLSELAKVEFNYAFWKKIRNGESTEDEGKETIKHFVEHYSEYEWVKVDLEIINSAKDFINKYGNDGLRSLDAIQLACAVYVKDKVEEYLTSDELLKRIFQKENLKVI